MKAVILAGGLGTRLSEDTHDKPKPMVLIGGMPILWHIMKIYSHYGINDFIICCGYQGYVIKEYFSNYLLHSSDVTIDFSEDKTVVHQKRAEPWKVTLIDTGLDTQTGGRVKRIGHLLSEDEPFCLTYGDGVIAADISDLIEFHKQHGKQATMTAVKPPGRFGAMDISADSLVTSFKEKPEGDGVYVNGGFFVLEKQVLDRIQDDMTVWENEPLISLSNDHQLAAYHHDGFWQPMDTLREKRYLNELWSSGHAPWKVWR